MKQLRSENLKQLVCKDLEVIGTIFLKQWIRQRLGLATQGEILERLSRLGDQKEIALNCLNLISHLYFEQDFPLRTFLIPTDHEIYCVDTQTVESYHAIVQIAETYFYNVHVCYNLIQLVVWIERELAKQWKSTAQGFIEKSLRLSSKFLVTKGREGMEVRLA